ncbi:MAG: DUF4375 domain-containing protein [Candidatus Melainabacteria bacterium]|nr:DUF4375 domain-containing protein [Candidatus Melainabacteria bacterium]
MKKRMSLKKARSLADGNFTKLGDFLGFDDPCLVFGVYIGPPSRLSELAPAARAIFVIDKFYGEMMNGDFEQFFYNTCGNNATEILASLRLLGAKNAAELLQKAMSIFPGGEPPQDRMKRASLLHEQGNSAVVVLNQLSEVFWDTIGGFPDQPNMLENIWDLQLSFMKEHCNDLIFLGNS